MKNALYLFFIYITLFTKIFGSSQDVKAYNAYSINHLQGLSNSAVLNIFQDNEGLMWFGTYDGLNCYDGKDIQVYKADFSKLKTLDNNIISKIQSAGGNNIWVQSFSGINLFSKHDMTVIDNYSFENEVYMIYSNPNGDSWVVSNKNIYLFNRKKKKFVRIKKLTYSISDIANCAYVDTKGTLHIIPYKDKVIYNYSVDNNSTHSDNGISVTTSQIHNKPIESTFFQEGLICMIDIDHDLYLYDISRNSKMYIKNLSTILKRYGKFANILLFHGDILITLRTGGILKLKSSSHYEIEMFRSDLRTFSSYIDNNQGIMWLGTDGQGVVKFNNRETGITNLMFNRMSSSINGQVRGILTDKYGTLWVGTKGDGLIKIPHYEAGMDINAVSLYSPKGKRGLTNYVREADYYPVFSLKKKKYDDDFWVGMPDSLLSYYSYKEDRIIPMRGKIFKFPIEIHGIYEQDEKTIWLATMGAGLLRITTNGDMQMPKVEKYHQLRCFNNQKELLEYSSMLVQGDSIFWLGSRGMGLVKVRIKTSEYQIYSLKEELNKAVDDILCLCQYSDSCFFVGTTAGLVEVNRVGNGLKCKYIGREQGLFNDMIHGIVKDQQGLLWLSTNKGVIKYEPKSGGTYTYYYSRGMEIGEFSDDSYYKCPFSGSIFFGGINGLLYLSGSHSANSEYYPPIILRDLYIARECVSLNKYSDEDNKIITLSENDNSFSLGFAALDFLNNDIEYSYILDGYQKEWSVFSKESMAEFKQIPPGEYVFKVRYKKDVLDTICKELSIKVCIIPNWYHSDIACYAYAIIVLLLLVYVGYVLNNRGFFKKISKISVHVSHSDDNILINENQEYNSKYIASFPNCTTKEHMDFVNKVLTILDENITYEELGSTFIADKMNMSPRQFYRRFKELSNIPPSDFIKSYKMDKAAMMLRQTNLSIQEVIEAVGISSRPYFYKEFARKFNATPKQYRSEVD